MTILIGLALIPFALIGLVIAFHVGMIILRILFPIILSILGIGLIENANSYSFAGEFRGLLGLFLLGIALISFKNMFASSKNIFEYKSSEYIRS